MSQPEPQNARFEGRIGRTLADSHHQLGHISNHAATVAEVLRSEGYATFCIGTWHLAPMEQCSAAGPFDQWPLARASTGSTASSAGRQTSSAPNLCATPSDRAAGAARGRTSHQ